MALTCGLVLGLAVAIVGTSAAYFKIKSALRPDAGRSNRVSRKDDGAESGHVSGTGRGRRAHPSSPAAPTSAATRFRAVFVCTFKGRKARTCKMARAAFFSSVRTPKTNLNNYCTPRRTRREPPEGGQPLHETQKDQARKAPQSTCRVHD